MCRAGGALVAEYHTLAQVQRDYQNRWRAQHRADQRAAARARAQAVAPAAGDAPALLCDAGGEGWRDALLDGVSGKLAQELIAVIDRVVRSVGRRRAMQVASWMLATIGVSDLDGEEQARVAHVVAAPSRVDAQVICLLRGRPPQLGCLADR